VSLGKVNVNHGEAEVSRIAARLKDQLTLWSLARKSLRTQAFAVFSPKIGLSWASVGGGVSRLTTTSRPIEMIAAG